MFQRNIETASPREIVAISGNNKLVIVLIASLKVNTFSSKKKNI